jgi:hypothetical protein
VTVKGQVKENDCFLWANKKQSFLLIRFTVFFKNLHPNGSVMANLLLPLDMLLDMLKISKFSIFILSIAEIL